MALFLLRGLKRSSEVVLGSQHLRELGVRRHAAYRALSRLEAAGLVRVQRKRGRAPRVTLVLEGTEASTDE
jgi:DNA-binding MarR family transcriptional regulator